MQKTKLNKKAHILMLIFVAVIFLVGSYRLYIVACPKVEILRGGQIGAVTDNKLEKNGIVSTGVEWSPLVKNADKKIADIAEWIEEVESEIYSYPLEKKHNISVSGEVNNGKTILRFKGYLTDDEGNRIEYLRKKSFDFVLDKEPFEGNVL